MLSMFVHVDPLVIILLIWPSSSNLFNVLKHHSGPLSFVTRAWRKAQQQSSLPIIPKTGAPQGGALKRVPNW